MDNESKIGLAAALASLLMLMGCERTARSDEVPRAEREMEADTVRHRRRR
jgi:outer membrane murein-binding lipoprotein Lpp